MTDWSLRCTTETPRRTRHLHPPQKHERRTNMSDPASGEIVHHIQDPALDGTTFLACSLKRTPRSVHGNATPAQQGTTMRTHRTSQTRSARLRPCPGKEQRVSRNYKEEKRLSIHNAPPTSPACQTAGTGTRRPSPHPHISHLPARFPLRWSPYLL